MNSIFLSDLVLCLSEAVDLVSPALLDHHRRTACAAFQLAEELGIRGTALSDIIIAAALHDVGGLSLGDRLDAIKFDFEDSNNHAEHGYRLISGFKPLDNVSKILKYHHTPWKHEQGGSARIGSQLVLMADRISKLTASDASILDRIAEISERVLKNADKLYDPELISVFKRLCKRDYFWLDIMSYPLADILKHRISTDAVELVGDDFKNMISIIGRMIDFRSRYTASHSESVAVTAEAMAGLMNFSDHDLELIKAAGYLHDFGKLAIPSEILEKPGALDTHEWNLMRSHAYYTHRFLSRISGLETVKSWAAGHHEYLDGSGYPFCLDDKLISTGSRIMTVSDIFTALIEDRPYRNGMETDRALFILNKMSDENKLDGTVVSVLASGALYIDKLTRESAALKVEEFNRFKSLDRDGDC